MLQLLRLPDGTVKVLIEGGERIKLTSFNIEDGYIKSNFIKLKDELNIEQIEVKALLSELISFSKRSPAHENFAC